MTPFPFGSFSDLFRAGASPFAALPFFLGDDTLLFSI